MNPLIAKISSELSELSDEKTRLGSRRFFKEEIQLHGVKSAELVSVGRKWFKTIKLMTKSTSRWMRRAAAVSFIVPARKGIFLADMLEILILCSPVRTIWCRKGMDGC